jgi:invasion protein IalB
MSRLTSSMKAALPYALLVLIAIVCRPVGVAHGQQTQPADGKAPDTEFAPRGQRIAREIKYGEWQKLCFKPGGTNMVCRTTVTGTFETGQTAVRVDLIEREGDDTARLQLFLPVGLYLPSGVKLSVDDGHPYHLPYVWCLTNACIAGDLASSQLVSEMSSGQKLSLEVVDTNVLSLTTAIPLGRFSMVHSGAPTKLFQQSIDEGH